MKLNFYQDAFILPSSILSYCGEASAEYLRVLLWLASDLSLADKTRQLAKLADCDARTVKAALLFWRERGLLCDDGEEAVAVSALMSASKTVDPPAKKHLSHADVLPQYTTTELANLLEARASLREVIDESQRILGRMFSTSEINVLLGMLDYLGMSEECVLLLLAHCKRIEKTTMRAIEKYAVSLADKGISDAASMEQELRTLEALHSFEGEIRKLFGIGRRALTAKEQKMLRAWDSYGYGIEMVSLAYEATVNAINEPSLNYANTILERWNAEGIRTPEDVSSEQREKEAKKNGSQKLSLGNSFDTDDFFEAAIQRTFRDIEPK